MDSSWRGELGRITTHFPRRSGFSLIEMSVVLVIVGLIVGSILLGQDVISSANARKIISELQSYSAAVRTFQGKYGCLPGDCANATSFFGMDGNCPGGTASPSGTCNGNGDGIIATNLTGSPTEDAYAVNQIGLSGLLPGKWPDGPTSDTCCKMLTVGGSVPGSLVSNKIGYQLMTFPSNNWLGHNTPAASKNKLGLLIGAVGSGWADMLYGAGINGLAARMVDAKIDDGTPGGGAFTGTDANFTSVYNANMTCLSGSAYSSSLVTGCTLYFTIQ